jgi:hypothetical protein
MVICWWALMETNLRNKGILTLFAVLLAIAMVVMYSELGIGGSR